MGGVRRGVRLIHFGDTLWHGHWSHLRRQFSSFDVVFVPINGAVLGSRVPMVETAITMLPEQAADAAALLGARTVIPIHFGFTDPPNYVEAARIEDRFLGQRLVSD